MQRLKIDQASLAVKRFVRSLPFDPEGVELELDGHVVCKVVAPNQLSESGKKAVLKAGWQQVRKTQERNRGVPAKVIQREIEKAVSDVRRKTRR